MSRDPRSLFELRRLAYRARRSEDARAVLLDAVLETFPKEFNALVKKGRKQMLGAAYRFRYRTYHFGGERPLLKDGATYFERTIYFKPSELELIRRFNNPKEFYSMYSGASRYLRAAPEQKALLFKRENMPLILRSGHIDRWREGGTPIPIYTFRYIIWPSEAHSS